MEKIKNVFSIHGEYNRLQYLVYGIIIPAIIIGIVAFLSDSLNNNIIFSIGVLLALYILIISMIKRARDTKYNTAALVILNFLPYVGIIAQLFLLFAPHGEKTEKNSNKTVIILTVVFVVIILGILAAVAIPKFNATQQQAQIAKQQSQAQ